MSYLEIIKQSLNDFFSFLIERKIFHTGVSFIIASQVNKVFTEFTNNIIIPISEKLIKSKSKNKKKKSLVIWGINFKYKKIISSILNLIFVLLFVYYLFKVSEPKGIFSNIFSKIKGIFS